MDPANVQGSACKIPSWGKPPAPCRALPLAGAGSRSGGRRQPIPMDKAVAGCYFCAPSCSGDATFPMHRHIMEAC